MQIVIGTAGHIDHGKTALVKALTGVDTDKLAEEKARGMSIDIGFAYLNDLVTIIDVPGHEKFIRNMVVGVSSIDLVLFVVALDDGIMPQTVEHLNILRLLGVENGIIVLTKNDLIDDQGWTGLVEKEILNLTKDTFLKNSPIVRTSISTGEGIDELKKEIINLSSRVVKKSDRGFFYMPIDRSFSKTGFGSIATGTVQSGKIKKGDDVEVIPSMRSAKVRGIQSHMSSIEMLSSGDRAAINLSGVNLKLLQRGAILAKPNYIRPVEKIIANILMISNTKWRIKNGQFVHLHIGTDQLLAKITMLNKPLSANESANALLQLQKPIGVLMDQKFIIRSLSPVETIAGCKVLDSNLINKKKLKNYIQNLEVDIVKRFHQLVDLKWKTPQSLGTWSRYFHLKELEIKKFIKSSDLINELGLIFSNKALIKSIKNLKVIIDDFHKLNPYQQSISKEQLISESNFSKEWLYIILDKLSNQIVPKNGGYANKNLLIKASNEDKKAVLNIEQKIIDYNLSLAPIDLIAPNKNKKNLEFVYLLKNESKIIEISSGLWVHINSFSELLLILNKFFLKNKKLTIISFKSITNTTRKSAIPLLEYLDKKNITIRQGNFRIKGVELENL